MGFRNWGNVPLFSTTAATQADPSTATLVAEMIIPVTGGPGSTSIGSLWEVRYVVGASTGALWRLECASGSGLADSAIRKTDNDSTLALQRSIVFTGSNQTSEFVLIHKAYPGDRFRVIPLSSFSGTAAASIEAEALS
jgi:hypothetical protein